MTDKQPKALRLANILRTNTMHSQAVDLEAAAELRRLHAENEDFRATCDHLTRKNAEQIGEIVAIKEQRDELLEALKLLDEAYCKVGQEMSREDRATGRQALDKARAAIAKAGGEKS